MSEEKSIQSQYVKGPIDVLKQMWLYILISFIITVPGLVMMGISVAKYPTHSPLLLGIDFTGGTLLQYGFEKKLTQEQDIPQMRRLLDGIGISNPVIQLQKPEVGMKGVMNNVTTKQFSDQSGSNGQDTSTGVNPDSTKSQQAPAKPQSITQMFKGAAQAEQQKETQQATAIGSVISIRTQDLSTSKTIQLQKVLKDNFGNYMLLQKERVGPTLAKELFIKAGWGLVLAYTLIVLYLTFRFQLDYAVMAIVALIHDTIFMLGAFSILGWFYHIEVDSMFVTAILTVVGFSVHDTIVVFDRIRENARVLFTKKLPFADIVNISVNQTLARSINTSFTAMLTLLALYFFGGESTRNFVLAMILGIFTGTYSSIFVASSLLAWWRTKKAQQASSSSSSSSSTRTQAV